MTGFRHLGDREAHAGFAWNVVVAEYEAPDGGRFSRDIVRSPGAVGVVPLVFDAEGLASVVLVSQYRPPYECDVIEIPAGMRDVPGEPTEVTAQRELIEEVGLAPGTLTHLIDMYPSPGMTDSVCTIYMATDCTPAEIDRRGPEEQAMEIVHVPLDDALAMIDRGEIVDAKTVCGLFATARCLTKGDGSGTT